jgi:hypothetical protein
LASANAIRIGRGAQVSTRLRIGDFTQKDPSLGSWPVLNETEDSNGSSDEPDTELALQAFFPATPPDRDA